MIIRDMKRMREDIVLLMEGIHDDNWQRELLSDALNAIDANLEKVMAEMRRLEAAAEGKEFHEAIRFTILISQ